MSKKTKVVTFYVRVGDHNRIHCIRIIRAISGLHLLDSKNFLNNLIEGSKQPLEVTKSTFNTHKNDMKKYGLLWTEESDAKV